VPWICYRDKKVVGVFKNEKEQYFQVSINLKLARRLAILFFKVFEESKIK
jgi:plasmid maintenance system killer protein